MENRSSIAGLVVAVALIGVAIAGGLSAGAIFGQSGEPAPDDEKVYQPDTSPTPLHSDPCVPPAPEACPLPPPGPPSPPGTRLRTAAAPVPFETGVRTDCPERWLSIGQPGIFSICYSPDMWDVRSHVSGEEYHWQSGVTLSSPTDDLVGLNVDFYPRNVPRGSNLCLGSWVPFEPAETVQIGEYEFVTCAVAPGHGQWKNYELERYTSLGLLAATATLAYTAEPHPLLPAVLDVLATLRIEDVDVAAFPPVPFETGLRADCPESWDSIGEPGLYSLCYRPGLSRVESRRPQPDLVQPDDGEGKDASVWWSLLSVASNEGRLEVAVEFYPTGIPPNSNLCLHPAGEQLVPVEPASAEELGREGVTCVNDEFGAVRHYIVSEQTSKGTLIADLRYDVPTVAGLGRAFEIMRSLVIEP